MESTRPIRALMRGLEALTVLNARDGATVSEVAQEVRLPRTTIYRILETLSESGFAFRDASDDRYRLTAAVRGLSQGFEDETWVAAIAEPCIAELGAELVWPVSVATLSGTQMMLREATDHATPLAGERSSAGVALPLLTTSAGRAYLAYCDAAQRDNLLDRLGTAAERSELDRALADIRSQGYATVTRTRRLVDEVSVSVPAPLAERGLAVVSVRFLSSAVPVKPGIDRFLPRLKHCAGRISTMYSEQQAGLPNQTATREAV